MANGPRPSGGLMGTVEPGIAERFRNGGGLSYADYGRFHEIMADANGRDLRYFAIRPADRIVGAWTAIRRCTRENGCLAIIPASHRGKLAEQAEPNWDRVNFGFFAAKDVDIKARVHVEMEPGDGLFFHPLLIHGSGRNRSSGFRRAISVHYASIDCERPEDMASRRPRTRRIEAAIKRIPPA